MGRWVSEGGADTVFVCIILWATKIKGKGAREIEKGKAHHSVGAQKVLVTLALQFPQFLLLLLHLLDGCTVCECEHKQHDVNEREGGGGRRCKWWGRV